MIEAIKELITALRDELQQYGEMLALLERQQENIVTRAAHEVFQSISVIKAQGHAIQTAREYREECQRLLAENTDRAAEITFAELMPALPPDYQPLVQALVDENNQLLTRVRQRARQNHLLLHRSVELMQGVLNTLLPARTPSLYTMTGDIASISTGSRALCNAVG